MGEARKVGWGISLKQASGILARTSPWPLTALLLPCESSDRLCPAKVHLVSSTTSPSTTEVSVWGELSYVQGPQWNGSGHLWSHSGPSPHPHYLPSTYVSCCAQSYFFFLEVLGMGPRTCQASVLPLNYIRSLHFFCCFPKWHALYSLHTTDMLPETRLDFHQLSDGCRHIHPSCLTSAVVSSVRLSLDLCREVGVSFMCHLTNYTSSASS